MTVLTNSSSVVIKGYHGTTRDRAERIMAGGVWLESTNGYDWLGPGVYFYQDAPLRAHWTAQRAAIKEARGDRSAVLAEPVVIEADIHLGNCLDLSELGDNLFVKTAYDYLVAAGVTLRTQKAPGLQRKPRSSLHLGRAPWFSGALHPSVLHNLDDQIMQWTFELFEEALSVPIDSVRCPFIDGRPFYKSSWYFETAQISINVRNWRNKITFGRIIGDAELTARVDELNRAIRVMDGIVVSP